MRGVKRRQPARHAGSRTVLTADPPPQAPDPVDQQEGWTAEDLREIRRLAAQDCDDGGDIRSTRQFPAAAPRREPVPALPTIDPGILQHLSRRKGVPLRERTPARPYVPPEKVREIRVRDALSGPLPAPVPDDEAAPVHDRLALQIGRRHAQLPWKALLPVRTRRVIVAQARLRQVPYPSCDGLSDTDYYAAMREVSRLTGTTGTLDRRAIEAVPFAAPEPAFTPRRPDGWWDQ